MIKVRVQGEDLFVEGSVFAVDPVTHSLVISKYIIYTIFYKAYCSSLYIYNLHIYWVETKEDSYTLIQSSNIAEIDGDLDLSKLPSISELGIKYVLVSCYYFCATMSILFFTLIFIPGLTH